MNIIYLHQYFSTPKGSSGLRSYEFAKALVNRGHAVTVVCGSYDGSSTGLEEISFKKGKRTGIVEGIRVIELALPYSNTHSYFRRVLVFLQYAIYAILEACRRKYDVVFATSTPLTAAIPGIGAHLLARKKFVFEVRDLWPELPKAMGVIRNPLILLMMSVLEWAAYKSAIRIIGLSPGIVSGITKHAIEADRVVMIPNACDEQIFSPERRGVLEIAGINQSDFVAIFSGTIGVANGVEAILDAAMVLKKNNRNTIKMLIIGRGNRREELKKRARDEGLDNCIFADPVSKTEIAGIVASSQVGLMVLADVPAFYYGTSPNKFFDYIASGLPVVNNYPGWLAEMISESNCGYAINAGDASAFADTLCILADNSDLCRKMGENAYLLSKKFRRSVMAEKFCDQIESVFQKRP